MSYETCSFGSILLFIFVILWPPVTVVWCFKNKKLLLAPPLWTYSVWPISFIKHWYVCKGGNRASFIFGPEATNIIDSYAQKLLEACPLTYVLTTNFSLIFSIHFKRCMLIHYQHCISLIFAWWVASCAEYPYVMPPCSTSNCGMNFLRNSSAKLRIH